MLSMVVALLSVFGGQALEARSFSSAAKEQRIAQIFTNAVKKTNIVLLTKQ